MFINKLTVELWNSGVRGVQIAPNNTSFHLCTVRDLQQLDVLENFCSTHLPTVNINKTKIVIFSKGSRSSQVGLWSYAGNILEIVQNFTYFGVNFTSKLSFSGVADDLANKGKRALNSVLSSMYKYSQLPKSVFFKLFDSKIAPIMLYGSELWGFSPREGTESVQLLI